MGGEGAPVIGWGQTSPIPKAAIEGSSIKDAYMHMNDRMGMLALLFGAVGFVIAITANDAVGGVFALCAGTLGWLAGRTWR